MIILHARVNGGLRYAVRVCHLMFVCGVLLVALLQGSAVAIGLSILGVQNALVLGVMSGILNLIPFVGFYFSLAVSTIVALLSGDPVIVKVLGVIALYVGLNISALKNPPALHWNPHRRARGVNTASNRRARLWYPKRPPPVRYTGL